MELRQLRYFVAVAEELHFGHAATRLHIVQSALSRQVALLERELGVALLERSGRGVALTGAGSDLLADALRVLAAADAARERAGRAGRGERGTLCIGFVAPAVYDLLPRTLRTFQATAPDVRLILSELTNAQAVAALVAGDIDVAFVRLPVKADPMLRCAQVSEEQVVVALPHDHRLAREDKIDLADLAADSFVMIPREREPELFDYYVAMCHTAGFSPLIGHDADRTHVAIGLVAAGLGVALVPASSRGTGGANVVHVPLGDVDPRLTLGVAWRRGSAHAGVTNFIRLRPWTE
jgi:DNA-binding transcriptional LysR family regulator